MNNYLVTDHAKRTGKLIGKINYEGTLEGLIGTTPVLPAYY